MKKQTKQIGVEVKNPTKECKDKKCPFHSSLKVRGRSFIGGVISSKAQRTVTIEIPRITFIKKYERYEKKRTKLHAHNPECINAKEGDQVRVMECKPISKTKNFTIMEII